MSEHNTSTNAPPPSSTALQARIRADKDATQPPFDIGRLLASIVTGVATLAFGQQERDALMD